MKAINLSNRPVILKFTPTTNNIRVSLSSFFSVHCLEKHFPLLNEHKIKVIVITAIHLITISYNFILINNIWIGFTLMRYVMLTWKQRLSKA